ncbi:tripartite tricarboxylate transporter TctB family protein [Ammoniphilus sp. 3BR4]
MTAGKIISPLLIIISLAVVVLSYTIEDQNVFDPSSASFFPFVIGVVMVICSIFIARGGIQSPASAPEKGKDVGGEKEEAEEEMELYEKEIITQKEINVRLILFTILVILFAVLMNYANFMIISFLFLMGSMLLLSKEKKFRSFLVSAITSMAFYYIFVHVFHIVFP